MPFGAPFPASGKVLLTFQSNGGVTNGSSFSFTANFGSNNPSRLVVAAVAGFAATRPSSLTIAGVSATKALEQTSGSLFVQIWVASVPTGASGTVTANGTTMTAECAVYTLVNAPSATPASTITSSGGSLTIATGAAVIAVGSSGTNGSATWTGVTADDTQTRGSATQSLASNANPATGSLTVSVSLSGASIMIAAAWSP